MPSFDHCSYFKLRAVNITAMVAFVYLTAVSVSCFLFAPVTEATTRLSRFSSTGLDSLVFTSNVLFETTSRSVLDCGRHCVRDARCVTFTRVKGPHPGPVVDTRPSSPPPVLISCQRPGPQPSHGRVSCVQCPLVQRSYPRRQPHAHCTCRR